MINEVSIGGIPVSIRRSEKRRNLGLIVERDGRVTASVPSAAKDSEILRLLQSRELWIHQALAKHGSRFPDQSTKNYVSGEGFHYLGRSYRLFIVKPSDSGNATPPLGFHQSRFFLRHDAKAGARDHFIKWYTEIGQRWLTDRLPPLARRVGVEVSGIRVKDLGFRWASCSKNGWLNFHWKTLQLPPAIITYLILHELCHLVEHNHSPSFWQRLRSVSPDHRKSERWLHENGSKFGF
jgi:predicted metal-dependent hydrolase